MGTTVLADTSGTHRTAPPAARPAHRAGASRRSLYIGASVTSAIMLIAVWHVISFARGVSPVSGENVVPNIADIFAAYLDLANYWRGGLGIDATNQGGEMTYAGATLALLDNTLASLRRLAAGLGIGILLAVIVAVATGWSRTVRAILRLPAHAARMIPLIAVIPLFSLWFGHSETGSIVFVSLAVFPIVFVTAETALDQVPGTYAEYARSLGAGPVRAYLLAICPAALPGIRGGVMLSLGLGWSMVIASEFLGQTTGLGNIVNQSQQFANTGVLALVGIWVLACAAATYGLASWLFGKLTRWAE